MTIEQAVRKAAEAAAGAFDFRKDGPPDIQLTAVVAAAIPQGAALAELINGLDQPAKEALVSAHITPLVRDKAKNLIMQATKEALG